MAQTAKIISGLQIVTLQKDYVLGDGSTLARRTPVVLVPQTLASAVIVENDRTLGEVWPEICRVGHEHAEMNMALADCQKEVIRLSDRMTAVEMAQKQGAGNA